MKLSERIQINDDRNEFCFDGFWFAPETIENFLLTPAKPGEWVRVAQVRDKMIFLEHKYEEATNET